MTLPPIDESSVGIVPGQVDGIAGYRSVCESLAADTTTVSRDPAAIGGRPIDLLVVEGGEWPGASIDDGEAPPTMYIGRNTADVVRALSAGADVFLHPDRIGNVADRLESLHRGAIQSSVSDSNRFPNRHSIEAEAYATLMDEFDDHVYVFDRHARFVRVNRAKADFHDTTTEALFGKTDFDLFFPETAMAIYADNMAVLEGRREVRGKTEWVQDSTGDSIHVTAVKHPIVDADGRTIGLLGISRDITEITRKRTVVDDVARVIEHLYGVYDHNFRNIIQTRIGVQAQLQEARSAEEKGRAQLRRLESTLSDTDLDDESRAILGSAIENWEVVVSAIEAAGGAEANLIDDLEALVEDFGELVSAVRTSGTITSIDIVTVADRAGSWTVTGPSITVRTVQRAARLFFDQLATAVSGTPSVTIERTDDGFDMSIPRDISIPEIATRYRDQDLLSGSTTLLKIRVLAEVMGWAIDQRPVDDGTVLEIDVDAWKRRARS